MKAPRSAIAKVINQKLDKADSKKAAEDIAGYLLAEKRVGELDSLMRDLQQIRSDQGAVEVNALSAHELDQNSINEIKTLIKTKFPGTNQIIINKIIDNDVVGGVRLVMANQQLDLTIRYKLSKFKQLTTS
ncbi:MAG: F0F1 ATP synthase subunit delta [bacterium]